MQHIAVSMAVGRMQCSRSFLQALSPASRASSCGCGVRGARAPTKRNGPWLIYFCLGAEMLMHTKHIPDVVLGRHRGVIFWPGISGPRAPGLTTTRTTLSVGSKLGPRFWAGDVGPFLVLKICVGEQLGQGPRGIRRRQHCLLLRGRPGARHRGLGCLHRGAWHRGAVGSCR